MFHKVSQKRMESEQMDVSIVTSSAGMYFKIPPLEISLSYYSDGISLSNLTEAKNWPCLHSPHGVSPLLPLPLPVMTTVFLPAPHSSEATEPEECCIFLKFPLLTHQRE